MSGRQAKDLFAQPTRDEDSTRRFKADAKNAASPASGMAVQANADDGSGLKQVPGHWPTLDFSGGLDRLLKESAGLEQEIRQQFEGVRYE